MATSAVMCSTAFTGRSRGHAESVEVEEMFGGGDERPPTDLAFAGHSARVDMPALKACGTMAETAREIRVTAI
jgi:hypothetical protein